MNSTDSAARRVPRKRLPAIVRERQLLDLAESLFTERGYEGVSIEDIARAAGVTRPIVYQHFGSKQGAFVACVRRARQEYEARLFESVARAGDNRRAKIRAGGLVYFDLIEDNPRRFVLLFSASAATEAGLTEDLSSLRNRSVQAIAEVASQQDPGISEHAALAFAYATSGIGEQLGRWWLSNKAMSKHQVIEYYVAAVEGAAAGILSLDNELSKG